MKKILLIAATAFVLTACDKDNIGNFEENIPDGSVRLNISASIGESSRASGAKWDAGDKIGITVGVGSIDSPDFYPYRNLPFVTEAGDNTFTGTDDLFFHNKMILTGYYPYAGDRDEIQTLTAKTDPENQPLEKHPEIDFLYARKQGLKASVLEVNPYVDLEFQHQMSKITFTFQKANKEVEIEKMRYFQIEGLKLEGAFNTFTGVCAPTSDAPVENLIISTIDGTKPLYQNLEDGVALPSLVVFPQKMDETPYLRMYFDISGSGDTQTYQMYHCSLAFPDNEIKPGHHYTFKVYVTKAGLILGEINIVGWDKVISSSLAATIDGDVEFNPEEGDKQP